MEATESGNLAISARERRWGLAAAIAAVTAFGLSVGEGGALLSLALEARKTDATITGLNSATAFLGVILGPLLVPRLVRVFGIRSFLLCCFGLDIVLFPMLHIFDSLAAWFALRILLGLIGSSIFTASEAWINLLAGDRERGRVIGIYVAFLSVGFGLGPLILSVIGISGWPPFLANMAIIATAALPLVGVGDLAHGLGRDKGASPLRMFRRAPFIVSAAAMYGLFESALMSLLPIWGVRSGLGQSGAAATLSAVYIGGIVLQPLIGWLSDRLRRPLVLLLCGVVGLIGAVLLILLAGAGARLFPLLFIWGGIAGGIYPVTLGMAGARFRGGEMVSINAAIIIAYGLGALAGPALGGAAMDLWNPQGLLGLFAVLFGLFSVTIFLSDRRG